MSAKEVAEWQAKINRIVGTELDGTPHWRLVWGQDPREVEYDRIAQVWLPRHHWTTVQGAEQHTESGIFLGYQPKYIGVPRYFIVAYVPPVHISDQERAATIDREGNKFDPYPNEATWMEMLCIQKHISKVGDSWGCCNHNNARGVNCYGEYHPFDAMDLRYLEFCYHEWRNAGVQSQNPNQDRSSTENRLSNLEFYRRRFSAKKAREQKEHEQRHQHMMEVWRTLQAAPITFS